MVTQTLFGETCKIIDQKNDWFFIKQWDSYKGWIYGFNGLVTDVKYDSNYELQDLNGIITNENGKVVTNIVFGAKVKAEKMGSEYFIELPNGNKAISENSFLSKPLMATRENIINVTRRFIGTPYLWGGKSSYGMDCSGLVQTVFKAVGINLPRDASQQAQFLLKHKIDKYDMKAGDLLFFGENEKITHVAISLGELSFINARGHVRKESIDENNSVFSRKLADLFLYGVSISEILDNNESA
jgi:cell wall-associated NlpC family hydrolase